MTSLSIAALCCEYRENPMGIDVIHPRLSWQLQSDKRSASQGAYQVLVASSEMNLECGLGLMWDSGKVESDQSIHVPYTGPALASGQRVYWKVRVWDEAGQEIESPSAWWEMGLLEHADWQAEWIGAPFAGGPRTTSPAPFLRKAFALQKEVVTARLYATAIGLYEGHLNGQRIGEAVLTPGWTDYAKHIQYQVYDVTDLLQEGVNAFGAILGDGWGIGHICWVGRQRYADRPQFLAQLVITYADGSQDVIATDNTWRAAFGPILESDMLMGESYDARRELTGWDQPGYDDARWWPAEVFADTGAERVATNGPQVTRHEVLEPVDIHEIPDFVNRRWIFDLGQNMVGWVRLRVCGEKGTTVTLRYAEVLNPDGTLYTINLRTARNTDHYTLKGDGEEVWEPHFVFHGFRYVELQGFPGVPTPDTVTGIVIHSDTPPTGQFECSDPLINQLQHNIVWGQKGNFVDVPTDCPQRDERLGWTGDAQVFIRTAAFNMDVAGFFTRWTRDLEDAQYPNGAFPAVAPNPGPWLISDGMLTLVEEKTTVAPNLGTLSIGDGGPAWADAGVICPWTIYLCYGDTRLLEARYASMRRFIQFLSETSRNGLRCYADYSGWHGFGDWLALDGSDGREGATSKELIGTAFFAYSAHLLAKIAHILGKPEDALQYSVLSNEVREAFVKRFVKADGTIEGDTQTSYVLALQFDLLPPDLRPVAAARLVSHIQQRKNHLSTGFVGTPYINWVLSEMGRLDTAYALLKQTTWPSWLYSVTQGATTIWERWDGWTHDKGFQDPGMNSFNHYAYGAIGAWLYAMVGGIDLDPEQPGYKHIIMRPQPSGDLTSAKAELCSMYGLIRSAWALDPEHAEFDWRITIPANTSATVYVPVGDDTRVCEGGIPAVDAPGVRFLRREAAAEVYEVAAGEYHFSAS